MKTNLLFLIFLLTVSCATPKKVIYFENAGRHQAEIVKQSYVNKIQKDDLLSIVVGSKSPELALPFNQIPIIPQQNSMLNNAGYLVSPEGELTFPILGKMEVAGLTHAELVEKIEKMIIEGQYINDPTVTVKLLNYKISILGEVATPGIKTIATDRVTIFEALGLAGDLTIYGRRDNVSLIREENGKRTVASLDINDKTIFESPYYYLHPNDVIYVEPNKKKVRSSVGNPALLSTVFSASSLIVTIVNFLTR